MGVTKIESTPPGLKGTDMYGISSKNWKPNALVAAGSGRMYMLCGTSADGWDGSYTAVSSNNGSSWSYGSGKFFSGSRDGVTPRGFVQFGKGYTGIPRDIDGSYFYLYLKSSDFKDVFLARAPTSEVFNRSKYQYCTGIDGSGDATWSSDYSKKKPVFVDPNCKTWGHVCATYNPGIKRYLMTKAHDGQRQFGVFEAEKPWGPWKTVYYGKLLDTNKKFTFQFPQKWMSADGRTLWLMWSGWPEYDKVCFIKCSLIPGAVSALERHPHAMQQSHGISREPARAVAPFDIHGRRMQTTSANGVYVVDVQNGQGRVHHPSVRSRVEQVQ
jgi:hypothetical protein